MEVNCTYCVCIFYVDVHILQRASSVLTGRLHPATTMAGVGTCLAHTFATVLLATQASTARMVRCFLACTLVHKDCEIIFIY